MAELDTRIIENRLHAARTRLVIDKPFLGALVLRLPLRRANPDWCRTTATDARHFYYNAEYIDQLTGDELQFTLAHEALHCALSHFARRGHRVKRLWDVACDYAINPLLIEDGLRPPPDSLHLKEYRGMTAEEIYPMLGSNDRVETLDQHVYDRDDDGEGASRKPSRTREDAREQVETKPKPDGGSDPGKTEPPKNSDQRNGNPSESGGSERQQAQDEGHRGADGTDGAPRPDPLGRAEMETLSLQWQQRLVGAAQQALQAGKLGRAMARMVDFMVQPTLPWRMLLARYVSSAARDDYNYSRPSSRRGEPAIFPSLRSAQLHLTVVVDVSGSVSDREIGEYLSEINALKSQLRCEVELLACDAHLSRGCPWVFQPWETLELPSHLSGGGGTNFCPPFAHVGNADRPPDALVYFTDARGTFPDAAPAYPVIWLVKGRAPVPWGQRIQLN
ncbi:MAG: VWA-like domain-containing protein [Thiotrichales bacterium]